MEAQRVKTCAYMASEEYKKTESFARKAAGAVKGRATRVAQAQAKWDALMASKELQDIRSRMKYGGGTGKTFAKQMLEAILRWNNRGYCTDRTEYLRSLSKRGVIKFYSKHCPDGVRFSGDGGPLIHDATSALAAIEPPVAAGSGPSAAVEIHRETTHAGVWRKFAVGT